MGGGGVVTIGVRVGKIVVERGTLPDVIRCLSEKTVLAALRDIEFF